MADVCLPTVYINRMDHLTLYVQVVTDATQELCDLILSSYREKLNLIWKSGECIKHIVYLYLISSGSIELLFNLCSAPFLKTILFIEY